LPPIVVDHTSFMEQAKGKKILSSRCVPITSKKNKKKEKKIRLKIEMLSSEKINEPFHLVVAQILGIHKRALM